MYSKKALQRSSKDRRNSNTHRPFKLHRSRLALQLEQLERRDLMAGVWNQLVNPFPQGSPESMMLLTDGSVLMQNGLGSTSRKDWTKLTPDASGSYLNGTYSPVASMGLERLYFPSNVLPDGRVFVLGGEYSGPETLQNWVNTAEIYDPVTNVWTAAATFPEPFFGDVPTALLPNGKILAGSLNTDNTYLYDPASNSWSFAATKLRFDASSEETWALLPNGNVLSYDIFASVGAFSTAQMYNPTTNTWIDAGTVPVSLSGPEVGFELGPMALLPDGRMFVIGANSNTALYTPSTNTWVAGPTLPGSLAADDAPAAMLPNGHVLFAADTPVFLRPTHLFDFDPLTNTLVDVTPPGALSSELFNHAALNTRMLMLPNGDVLFSDQNSRVWEYTPDGGPNEAWRPSINTITANGQRTFTLTGTQLNGLSEGATYGDDAEMSTNYPIIQLTDPLGTVSYARSFNWKPGVATGSAIVSTQFVMPANVPDGVFQLRVIANGIASQPRDFVSFSGLGVIKSTPVVGSVINTRPTTFSVTFNQAVDSSTLQAADLKVNGLPAKSVSFNATTKVATFTYATSPVTTQGVQSMSIVSGSIKGTDGSLVQPFNIQFRYDASTLSVASTSPAAGGSLIIPASSNSFVVQFSEAIDPTTVSTKNLNVSQGTVTAATVLPGNKSVSYTLTGLKNEGPIQISLPAGRVKDQFGNPGFSAFSATYQVDLGGSGFPLHFDPALMLGSMVYQGSHAGLINSATDSDPYVMSLTAGQTLTVYLETDFFSDLQAVIKVISPQGVVLGTNTAISPGNNALLQTIPISQTGAYKVIVSSTLGSVGNYQLTTTINAAYENEFYYTFNRNDTAATAENINSAFVALPSNYVKGSRAAVLGGDFGGETTPTGTVEWVDYYSFTATAGTMIDIALTQLSGAGAHVSLEDSSARVLASSHAGATNYDQGITSLMLSRSGTFYVRVSGPSLATYELVVAKNAVQDTEANDTPATATNLPLNEMALGYVISAESARFNFESGDQGFSIDNNVLPNSTGLWHVSGRQTGQPGHSSPNSFYYGSELTGTYSTGTRNSGAITSPLITLAAGHPLLSFNYLLDTEGEGDFDIAKVSISLDNGVSFATLLSSQFSTLRTTVAWQHVELDLSAYAGQNVQIQFAFDSVDDFSNDFGGWHVDDIVIGSGEKPDWYSVTLPAAKSAISLQTQTPADGSAEFHNGLNPKIDLFDSTGTTLIASGIALPDGRNEELFAGALTPGGTYKVRVIAEGTTRGEYTLSAKPLRTPTITSQVDDAVSGAAQPDGKFVYPTAANKGWKTVSDPRAYQGDYRIHMAATALSPNNVADWTIAATSAQPELFATWVALPGNATNAVYEIYMQTSIGTQRTLKTVTVDQSQPPCDAVLFGSTLATSLGSVAIPNWKPGTQIHVRLMTFGANGNVVADGVFDPPSEDLDRLASDLGSAHGLGAPQIGTSTTISNISSRSIVRTAELLVAAQPSTFNAAQRLRLHDTALDALLSNSLPLPGKHSADAPLSASSADDVFATSHWVPLKARMVSN